jgi:hypothetical protein
MVFYFTPLEPCAFLFGYPGNNCRKPELLIRTTFWQVGYITSKFRSLAGRVFERGPIERSLLQRLLPLLLLSLIAFLAGR